MKPERTIESRFTFANESYSFTWVIENFDLVPYMRDHPIYGPSIKLGKKVDSTWQLRMCKEMKSNGFKTLKFRLFKAEENTVWDSCEYSVFLKSKDCMINVKCVDNEVVGGCDDLSDYFRDDDDENSSQNSTGMINAPLKEKRHDLTVLDAIIGLKDLIVACDISYTYLIEDSNEPLMEPCEKTIAQNLLQLYESRKFCDIILCAGEKEFPAHRNILSSRAPGFDLLLQDTRAVGQQQKLELGVSEPIAELMIKYVYTGSLPEDIDFDTCCDLQNAALKYGIDNLEHYMEALKAKSKDKSVSNCCHKDEGFISSSVDDQEIMEVVNRNVVYNQSPYIYLEKSEHSKCKVETLVNRLKNIHPTVMTVTDEVSG